MMHSACRNILDLRCAAPDTLWTDDDPTLFSPLAERGGASWRVVDYECETHAGKMLWGFEDHDAVLSIPLEADGWHAVHLLIGYADLDVRLSGGTVWQNVRAYPPYESQQNWAEHGMWPHPLVWEPVRFADLTGKDLEIRVPHRHPLDVYKTRNFALAALWGVRVTPLPDKHVARLQAPEPPKRMVYVNDGFGIFFYAEKPDESIVPDALGPFLSDRWHTACYGIGQRGYPNYASGLVDHGADRAWTFVRHGDRRYRENVRALVERGVDTLRQAADLAHAAGQTFWVYLRPQLWSFPMPFDHAFHSDFYAAHPELRCVEADGRPVSKLSVAFPEVRAHFAAFIDEALDRGANGVCLALTRGYPLVRYEQPVLDRVRERHGVDARELPETDERLRGVWAEFVTEWLREIRAQLDARGGKRRRELAAFIHPAEKRALFGCDVAAWIAEELVNVIMPAGLPSKTPDEFAELARLTAGTRTQLIPGIRGGDDRTVHSLRKAAHLSYEAGADGLTYWDTEPFVAELGLENAAAQRLWWDHYMADRCVRLVSLCGENLRPWNPALGG